MKKGKQSADAKKKGLMPPPEEKKKGLSKSKSTQSRTTSKMVGRTTAPGKGTSANSGVDLGPNAFILENPGVAEKLLQGLTLPVDQVELDEMDLDWAITKFFHVVGQVKVLKNDLILMCLCCFDRFYFLQVVVI